MEFSVDHGLDVRNKKVGPQQALSWGLRISNVLRHLKGGLEVVKYHGQRRPKDLEVIGNSDIVLTTYKTLAVEYEAYRERASILHRVRWYRVVLDEGKHC